MKLSLSLILMLVLAGPAYAGQAPSPEIAAMGAKLDFVADVSKYQGMFDSVVEFCRPHAPPTILEQSRQMWLSNNQEYLGLRDRELARAIADARVNGADAKGVEFVEHWAKQQYQGTFGNNRMYKDLVGLKDLPMACSKRLGEMNSSGMSLQSISPRTVRYAESIGEP